MKYSKRLENLESGDSSLVNIDLIVESANISSQETELSLKKIIANHKRDIEGMKNSKHLDMMKLVESQASLEVTEKKLEILTKLNKELF